MDLPLRQVIQAIQAAMFKACKSGSWQEVHNMLEFGAIMSRCDAKGRNVLHHASLGDNYEVAEKILELEDRSYRYMLYQRSRDGCTPVMLASLHGHALLVRLFVDQGAPFFTAHKETGWTALHLACLTGYDSVVKQLLRHRTANINFQDNSKFTPLHLAVCKGHGAVVRTLLDLKADVNCSSSRGFTPLHKAVIKMDLCILNLILERGPDIEAPNIYGNTPLHTACFLGNEKAVEILIAYRAEVNTKTWEGLTPLHIACKNVDINIVQLLLRAGANVNMVSHRRTPLYFASMYGDYETARLLLAHRARVYVSKGRDPVRAAARAGHWQIVKMLTDHHYKSL